MKKISSLEMEKTQGGFLLTLLAFLAGMAVGAWITGQFFE